MSKWRDLWVADYSTKILLWWENLLCHLSKKSLINSAVTSGHDLGKVCSQLRTLFCEWHEAFFKKIPFWCDRHAYPNILLHHCLHWLLNFPACGPLSAPCRSSLCHQGAPGTHHIIIRTVTLTTHQQPAHRVFPTGRNITSSLSQLKKWNAEFTQNSQICFISIVSNPQQIDVYFFLFFFPFQ